MIETVYKPAPPPYIPPPLPPTVSPAIMPSYWQRKHVLRVIASHYGYRLGAEIGVADGETSAFLLAELPQLHMIGVDARRVFEHNPVDDFALWDHAGLQAMAEHALAPFGDRATLVTMTSMEAAERVPDASLDFVFIDADHSEAACRADIAAWLPKLRPDGMLTGHDINWPGVFAAVEDMVPAYQIAPDVVWFCPVHPAPNWWRWLHA